MSTQGRARVKGFCLTTQYDDRDRRNTRGKYEDSMVRLRGAPVRRAVSEGEPGLYVLHEWFQGAFGIASRSASRLEDALYLETVL